MNEILRNNDLITNNKLSILEKSVKTVNTNISNINNEISDINDAIGTLEGSSGSSLLQKYSIEDDWGDINSSSTIFSGGWSKGLGGSYNIFTVTDYNSDTVRECARLQCDPRAGGYYTSLYKNMGRMSSTTNITFINKILMERSFLTNGSTEVLIGLADAQTPSSTTKNVWFRLLVTNSAITTTCVTRNGGTSTSDVIATSLLTGFHELKLVTNGLTDVKFYVDNVLYYTKSLSIFSAIDMNFTMAINNVVLDASSSISARLFIDYTKTEVEYIGGR